MSDQNTTPSPSAITSPEIELETAAPHSTDCIALVIAWSAREPERVGEVALLTPDYPLWILGRSPDSMRTTDSFSVRPSDSSPLPNVGGQPVTFFRQRPLGAPGGTSPETANSCIGGESISRRQLALWPSKGALTIHNIGRCELTLNGQPVREAVVHPGDTLYLKSQLLLYCTRRPLQLPALKAYPPSHIGPFGATDSDGMVGESPIMWKLRERLAACARTGFHVLVIGNSGSGKELAAQAIHGLSPRAGRKMIADNIAAIPPGLAAALLFGNKKNFPNPGMEERIGLIGAANGSTLFLDEIGDMPEEVQPMFLRVTERSGEYFRLGEENRLQKSDFRLVGATNRPERMRYELKRRFQRELRIPDLNHRKEDIPLLIQHLLLQQTSKDDFDAPRFVRNGEARVHPRMVEQLLHHTYKTHVSEVAFLLGHAMAESEHDIINPLGSELRIELPNQSAVSMEPRRSLPRALPTREQAQQALERSVGNVSRAAAALNISRDQLNRLIQREGLVIRKQRRTESADPASSADDTSPHNSRIS